MICIKVHSFIGGLIIILTSLVSFNTKKQLFFSNMGNLCIRISFGMKTKLKEN